MEKNTTANKKIEDLKPVRSGECTVKVMCKIGDMESPQKSLHSPVETGILDYRLPLVCTVHAYQGRFCRGLAVQCTVLFCIITVDPHPVKDCSVGGGGLK